MSRRDLLSKFLLTLGSHGREHQLELFHGHCSIRPTNDQLLQGDYYGVARRSPILSQPTECMLGITTRQGYYVFDSVITLQTLQCLGNCSRQRQGRTTPKDREPSLLCSRMAPSPRRLNPRVPHTVYPFAGTCSRQHRNE